MLKIRLTRVGKKNSPAYRVVVADHKRAVKGKFLEIIGHYNPTLSPKEIVIDKERALYWLKQGAQASDTVNNLMCDLEILPKKNKIKKVFAKKSETEATEAKSETPETVESTEESKTEEAPVVEEAVEETK